MSQQPSEPHRLLFLCSGNYYRSRFAEVLFNSLARESHLDWQAFSRGLVADRENGNEGPISPHALRGLEARGVPLHRPVRFPSQVTEQELEGASMVIALKEAEHRPILEQRFPRWPDQVDYWHVDDLDCAAPDQALTEIEGQVGALLERLRSR